MAIQREIWENHLMENLFPNNEFLKAMTDSSEYVNFKTVHTPSAGGKPNVVKNRTLNGVPVNSNTRADVTTDWPIDEYTTDPFQITNAEEVELSYSKRDSILYNQQMAIRQTIAGNILVTIAPNGTSLLPDGVTTNANILRTTGFMNNNPNSQPVSSASYLPGTNGSRLNFTAYDVLQASTLLDNLDVPMEDRFMLLSAKAYNQFILDLTTTQYRDFSATFDAKTGVVGMMYGFKFFKRSSVCTYNNAATPVVNAYGAVANATDNDAALFWQKEALEYAIGDIHVYELLNDPHTYADSYSALIRMGGNIKRPSQLGLGAIVQGVPAQGN